MTQREANKKMVVEVVSLELDVAAVFEEQLQMFGVEAELGHGFADRVRCCAVGGWTSPAVRASRVFECQVTAVLEEDCCLREFGIGNITCRVFPGEIGDHRNVFYACFSG